MFINSKDYHMTVPGCICGVLLWPVCNSLPCVVKHVYVLGLCVIYAAASAGGERVGRAEINDTFSCLFMVAPNPKLDQKLASDRRGWWRGRGIGDEEWQVAEGEVKRAESGPQSGAEKWYEKCVERSNGSKGMVPEIGCNITPSISKLFSYSHMRHKLTGSWSKF